LISLFEEINKISNSISNLFCKPHGRFLRLIQYFNETKDISCLSTKFTDFSEGIVIKIFKRIRELIEAVLRCSIEMKVDYLISLFKQTKNLILLTLYSNSIFQ
jgi:hypothetical protein